MKRAPNIDLLCDTLGLSPYQRDVLKANYEKYDITRLVKRGGVLFAPHAHRGRLFAAAVRLLRGVPADLIGRQKMLLRGQRRVKFYADGFHSVNLGRFRYYADAAGQTVSYEVFDNAMKKIGR